MSKRPGFSLLEVVAAAALIGIVLTFMAPSIKGSFENVKNQKLKNDLTNIGQAVQIYYVDKGSYPATLEALVAEKYLNVSDAADLKDAKGDAITYDDDTGNVSGKNADGTKTVTYDGYKLTEEDVTK